MNFGLVRIFHVLAADNRLAQKFHRLVVRRNENIDIREFFIRNFRERMIAQLEQATIMDKRFQKAENFYNEQ